MKHKDTMTDDFGHECTEIRKLPIGGGANIFCGRTGFDQEMRFRKARNAAHGDHAERVPAWESLEIVFPEGKQ